MYEPIIKPWEQYRAKQSPQWRQDDPRHHLAAEVGARLTQLNLVLTYRGRYPLFHLDRERGLSLY